MKVTKIVEIVSHVVNEAETYKVEANVRVNNDVFNNAENGIVSDTNGNTVAIFNLYGSNNLNINYQTNDSTAIQEISKQVSEFLEQCKSNINSLTTVAVD